MRRRVIGPTRLSAAGLGVFAMSWLLIAPIADAATARADLKDAGGVKVGEASLQDTPQGVKVSATFTDLPAWRARLPCARRGPMRAALRVGRRISIAG